MIDMPYRNIFSALAVFTAMFINSGCIEHLEEVNYPPTENVSFKVSLNGGKSTLHTKGFTGNLEFEEEDWTLGLSTEAETKATLYNSLNEVNTAGVFAYIYDGNWNTRLTPLTEIANAIYNFDGDQLNAENPIKWSTLDQDINDGAKFRIFAYGPHNILATKYQDQSKSTGAPTISVDMKSFQHDIIVADTLVTIDKTNKTHRKELPMDFEHIFTAIQFKAGFDCTITKISITGLKTTGDYVLGSGWNFSNDTDSYTIAIPEPGLTVSNGSNIWEPILMLPQKFTTGSAISLTYLEGNNSKTMTADLSGVEWRQGKKITYTLMKDSEREYIYLDLAAGDVTIKETSYTGYIFKNQTETKVEGAIATGQKYYIYQSCTTNENSTNYKVGWSGSTFTLPVYEPATLPDNTLWSDYITNNDNVEDVIEAWDDKKGATDNTINNDKAVRRAGRESTKHTIHISGSVGACNMIIDNIYCSFTSDKSGNRTKGSITYNPSEKSGSKLTLHLLGDNRIGSIQYDNQSSADTEEKKNNLIIEGEGSLTVADSDFTEAQGYDPNNGGVYGYYSNHYDAAIGNADNKDDCYGIIINSGTIFAGTTAAENCTAIGGGGNGVGEVTINGGVVTAVASTTGTAIGGGIGYSAKGGKGIVTITGGNVYAYNHANPYRIPSSAIGGAGSSASSGTEGTVTITGGNIYAESGLGTAIGGGSSKTKHGGKGVVKISGGYVIAKAKDPDSAGIGGGSSYTGGYSPDTDATNNGGDAVIHIEGNPILRTGSIGGGTPGQGKTNGGKIGSAQITVEGGDIQAQFVMADSPSNEFTMKGGLIRNSSTSDNEYFCIQPNGAAVYMEKGTFTMKGGMIKQCSADKTDDAKGGAVYIKGDSDTKFIMEGGEIRECKANTDGGAVYLEGGKVTITGGVIEGNVAYKGNGGAISILGGDFTMNGQNASINKNAAFGNGVKGNGGGIYVAPASSSSESTINVKLMQGSITSNSADRNGGGVCVDMGSNIKAALNVTTGESEVVETDTDDGDEGATDKLNISQNSALTKGGGMYVNGAKANVTLYDGKILNNETSSYQVNPDISVDGGGLVTLLKPGVTTQVTITFNNNAQYFTKGETADSTYVQYVVAASKSKLNGNEFEQINEYYEKFTGWNTRRDGTGDSYTDLAEKAFNEDITLYAQWQ